jgi:hypothetical protein
MASNREVTGIGFPVRKFDERVARWVARISEALKKSKALADIKPIGRKVA